MSSTNEIGDRFEVTETKAAVSDSVKARMARHPRLGECGLAGMRVFMTDRAPDEGPRPRLTQPAVRL